MTPTPGQAQRIGQGPRTVFVLHGILGSARNWRSFCRRLSDRRPDLSFHLFDLRNHGDAPPAAEPHTLEACADDLDRRGEASVVMGHSGGGKVALTWAKRRPRGLEQAIILDAQPGPTEASPLVQSVLGGLRAVPTPATQRSEVRDHLVSRGLPDPIVAWLLTSLRRTPAGWEWCYHLAGIEAMMADYGKTDLWSWLEARRSGPAVDFVRAERSDQWTPSTLRRVRDLQPASETRIHTLTGAGHWLHIDNPAGLEALLARVLLRQPSR